MLEKRGFDLIRKKVMTRVSEVNHRRKTCKIEFYLSKYNCADKLIGGHFEK
jgi:hypothetical protein